MFLPFGAIFFSPAKTYPPTLQSRKGAQAAVGTAADPCEEEDDDSRFVERGPRSAAITDPLFPPFLLFSAPASSADEIPHGHTFHPPAPQGDSPSRGLSAAADPPSQGAPLAARPPLPRVPRREHRRRSVRPSLTCREVRLLLLRTAAARCPCLPSHRPHAGPRASNHCSAGARSLAPVSSITRHKISSPFALF
ncbi:hypothetical protein PVAP13_9KG314600 [Panicum virgatum]|uniref:Uncharacterized protein n=1 Tax=Panicum virgatum TaxID=38727 RepID=A0A8T0NN41_PANVG|nr:hypothetical protein PVAP13_9KG314600 [Panicum virgatum]